MKIRRFEREALQKVFHLSLPIALQNIFSTAVSSADVIMVGYAGQDALSAVSLAGQIQFVLNLIFLGLTLGTSLMTAQYWGRRDRRTIENILGIVLKIGTGVSLVFAIGACGFPKFLMQIFTSDRILIAYGVTYLRIVGISYLFMGVSQVYLAVIKAMGFVGKSTLIGSSALVLNILFNGIFIFGLFGLPKMGVAGAALGTLLARGIELLWCLKESCRGDMACIRISCIRAKNRELIGDFWKYALPITINGLSWGSAFASYSVIMGHMGSDVVAANSMATVARNFAMVGCNGLATGAGIYLGELLGKEAYGEVQKDSGKILKLTVFLGVLGGLVILLTSPLLSSVSDLTGQAQEYLKVMLWINAAYVIAKALNVMFNNGIFCAGGDTRFGLICDTVDMWCFSVPLGFFCAFWLKLPPMMVYGILCLDEVVKLPFMFRHFRGGKWIKNITRPMEQQRKDRNTKVQEE